ncbi:hypothetical protein SAMN04487989_103258 [Bizionia echini]|uniref:Uncharacterized protein n=1 Tax=Bizionia echini TaxID=649333 RepID=A0A1I5BNN1_9FLAO|nr:hypothetical protein SAMN04487989_103258 [Bizionia echini]
MLTDKQSLILCGIVGVGFSIAGIFGFLENYMISGIFVTLFIVILINIFITVKNNHEQEN